MDSCERKHPAHLPNLARTNTSVMLFVTVCASDRAVNTFANEPMHRILRVAWEAAGSYVVGAYVLMPDHIHLFCAPAAPEVENVARWVRYWKSLVTRSVRGRPVGMACVRMPENGDERTLVPPGPRPGVFQRDCWDTQLRRGESYHDKWEYVRNNPVRRGFVDDADMWPYWGVLRELVW